MKRKIALVMCILIIGCNSIPAVAADIQSIEMEENDMEKEGNLPGLETVNQMPSFEEEKEESLEETQDNETGKETKIPTEDAEQLENEEETKVNSLEKGEQKQLGSGESAEDVTMNEPQGIANEKIINTISAPAPVYGLKAQNTGKNISISWNASADAEGYIIYRRVGGGKFEYLYILTKTSFTDLNASSDEYNFYRVYPYKIDKNGNRVMGTSISYVYAKSMLPAAENLKVKETGNKSVALTWSKVSGAEGYIIYRKIGTGKMVYRYMVSGTSFRDTTASNVEFNFYRIYPYFTNGLGKRVLGPSKNYVFAKGQIGEVTGVRASGHKGYVNITWNKASNVDGYIIYRRVGNSAFEYRYMTSKNNMQDTTASTEEINYYRVYAYSNESGQRIIGKAGNYTYAKAVFQGKKEYGEGMYYVGSDIPAGNYVVIGNLCYFEICNSIPSDYNTDNIIENDIFSGNRYITLHAGEYYKVERGKTIPLAAAPKYTGNGGRYGEGMYMVGRDISPGRYLITLNSGEFGGYYEIRRNAINGSDKSFIEDIINNEFFSSGSRYVTVQNGQYLIIERASAVKR